MGDRLDRDKSNNLRMRPALPSDSLQLLDWRNHELVRRFSKNSSLITEQDHNDWVRNKLDIENTTHRIFVFHDDLTAVGMTRIDLIAESKGEISIIVDPNFFSRGYGSFMLRETIQLAFSGANLINLLAVIHNLNFASKALFAKNGFRKLNSGEIFSTYSLVKQEIST